MSASEFAGDFYKLFVGNRGFYVEHPFDIDEKKKKSSDKVASEAYFKDGEVTETLYERHLEGAKGLGICPINESNKCKFGVIDIDDYSANYSRLVDTIYEYSLPIFPFRTKSGGMHLYVFFKKEVAAKSVVESLESVCSYLGLKETFVSRGKTKVEIIPKQVRLAAGGHGATITLPYFRCHKPKSYLYGQNMSEIGIEGAIKAIRTGATSIEEMDDALKSLPYSDAPKCIQTILLGPSLEKDSGRNNFLFSCAVYLKKKHGDGFFDKLQELNNTLIDPLDEVSLKKTAESVRANEYNYKCKDVPCEQFCDRAVCSKREFGVGKEKGHFTGLDYGTLTRYKSEEPYYVWELRRQDDTNPYKKITFKSAAQLMDQKYFASVCIDQLSFAPTTMDNFRWTKVLNTCLEKVVEQEIKMSTDTSSMAEIKNAFYEYLSQKKTRRDMPYQIKLGLVHCVDDRLYFTHKGFQDYLEVAKLRLVQSNLREVLLSFGATEDTLQYKSKRGVDMSVPCWMKKVDDRLRELTDYFSDVIEGDIGVIESEKDKDQGDMTDREDDSRDDEDALEGDDDTLF